MLNKQMPQNKHKVVPLKFKYTENISDSQISENFPTEAFYRHALTLRKAFGIKVNSSSSPDLTLNDCVFEPNQTKRETEKNNFLPTLQPKFSLKYRSSYSPYMPSDIRSSVTSKILTQLGSNDNKEGLKRIRKFNFNENNIKNKQLKSVKNKILPRLNKPEIKLVQSDQIGLLTGW